MASLKKARIRKKKRLLYGYQKIAGLMKARKVIKSSLSKAGVGVSYLLTPVRVIEG